MAGIKNTKTTGGLYQAWYFDFQGKKRTFTMRSKTEVRRKAFALEEEHKLIRVGLAPLPNSATKHRIRSVEEVTFEYVA